MQPIQMVGKRFGAVVGISPTGRASASRDLIWLFRCDCGREFETSGYSVRCGKVTSCPTCGAERTRVASVKHGRTETPEFEIWTGILTRCLNPRATAYPDYGGRGITVCERWRDSFASFLADMGERPSRSHSIDRIDCNGNYEPENCRWATTKEQARNKRSNRLITIDGRTQPVSAWAEEAGLTDSAIHLRIKAGWTGAALISPSKLDGCLEFNGVRDTYEGWSKRTGIKPSTIAMRLKAYGWPIEKALTQGARL